MESKTDNVVIAFHMHKVKDRDERRQQLHKRIREEVWRRCVEMDMYHLPFILMDDGSFEASHFLEICANAGCLMAHLFENVYFCPKHIRVHMCHEKSITCVVSTGPRGSACCILSGMDLARHRAMQGIGADDCDVESFDERTKSIQFNNAKITSRVNRDDKSSEDSYKRLKVTMSEVIVSLCSQEKRVEHNMAISKQGSHISSRNKKLVIFENNDALEKNLYHDALTLCETILRNAENKQERKLLLRNMISFVVILIQKIVMGIYNKGIAILPPMNKASTHLDPLPCNFMLERYFGLKLSKYSECLNCIQHILEKSSFAHAITFATFYCSSDVGSNNTTLS